MSGHLEEGRLQAYLDGELADAREVEAHLDACPECRARVEELHRLGERADRALARLETGRPDVEAALWEVRRRRAARRAGAHRRRLAAAAVVVLTLGAGAAAAMPGSPIRGWIEAWLAPTEEPVPAAVPAVDPAAVPEDAGVLVDLVDGAVTVRFHGVPAGALLEVRFVEGARAGVYAPSAARFETAAGRVDVHLEGDGDVLRVELPRDAARAEVLVEGESVFRWAEGRTILPGPHPAETLEDGVRLRISGNPHARGG